MMAADFSMETTYRADLRELNELNFARFDAKLEQRTAELDSKFARRWLDFEAKVEMRLATFEAKVAERLATFETKIEKKLAEFDLRLNCVRAELIKWMFVFWIGTLAPLAGLIILLTR